MPVPRQDDLQTASTRDGTTLRYRVAGARNGRTPIALVHSLAMDHAFWQPVAARLAEDRQVLTFDCRGHGSSGKPRGPYTVELFARDLADLLDHLGWASAVVAGASMGGCVSLAFAAGLPTRTVALGLVDTTAWYGAEAPAQWAERAARAAKDGMGTLVEFQTTRWFGDQFRSRQPDVVKECVDVFLRNDVAAYIETCKMLGAADLRAVLPSLTMPTAIVVGEEDYATPVAMAEALHRGIKGSTLTVLPRARHLTPLEVPERITTALRELAAQTD
ncbi:MAG: alpha/beta fold hydrolase [Hyphomicrobiales bacterium]|nr:alpha/beta fold hydrolase [Hyphomicrobiales bacterium]